MTHKEPSHPLKVTAWCAVYSGGVIGTFYSRMPRVKRLPWSASPTELWSTTFSFLNWMNWDQRALEFQQNGAISSAPTKIQCIFGSTRSLNLTAPDFLLYVFFKPRAYVNKLLTLEALKENIRHDCENLSSNSNN